MKLVSLNQVTVLQYFFSILSSFGHKSLWGSLSTLFTLTPSDFLMETFSGNTIVARTFVEGIQLLLHLPLPNKEPSRFLIKSLREVERERERVGKNLDRINLRPVNSLGCHSFFSSLPSPFAPILFVYQKFTEKHIQMLIRSFRPPIAPCITFN